ncbi:MAPEG family protein [Aestuariibius sp. HNIBRBA575]|uniref:MAPEG family protein n=1 Tax=Aestuariibius sp. HNIBRBA575 TaxID=3233343 RepID=UPI0034A2A3AD
MTLPITTTFILALAVLMLVLWFNVTKTRAAMAVSIGDGGDTQLHERIRRHGNFVEWVPLSVLMLALAELQGASAIWLYLAGGLCLFGRLVHPFGLRAQNAAHPARIVGNSSNILAVLILMGVLARQMMLT